MLLSHGVCPLWSVGAVDGGGSSGAFELLLGRREELHLVVDRTPARELRLGTGRSRRARPRPWAAAVCCLTSCHCSTVIPHRSAACSSLVFFGCAAMATPVSVVIDCSVGVVFFVARYAGGGLAPAPL